MATSEQPTTPKEKKLTAREQKFVERYAVHLNGVRAAKEAGYSLASAREIATQNLSKLHIQAALKSLLETRQMSEEEGTSRLGEWGRGDISLFLNQSGNIDLTTEQARANMHLIKKIRQDRFGGLTLELYDAKDAVVKVLEVYGRINPTGQVPPVVVNIIRPAPAHGPDAPDEL